MASKALKDSSNYVQQKGILHNEHSLLNLQENPPTKTNNNSNYYPVRVKDLRKTSKKTTNVKRDENYENENSVGAGIKGQAVNRVQRNKKHEDGDYDRLQHSVKSASVVMATYSLTVKG